MVLENVFYVQMVPVSIDVVRVELLEQDYAVVKAVPVFSSY